MTMRIFKASTYERLFGPVHPASLGLLRICFGVLMIYEFTSIKPYIIGIFTNSKFFITYDYFHWVKPVPVPTMEVLFTVGTVAAAMVLVGLLTRPASIVVAVLWSYIFLVCRGHYTNHYYLFCLVGFWMAMVDSNRWLSIDRLLYHRFAFTRKWILGFGEDKESVPYWQVLIFQAHLVMVYFYGGLAKIGWDWMLGYPMRLWLPAKPWLPDIMKTEWVGIFMSWSGMVFDLGVGWLLWSKWRKWALPFVVFFHVTNHIVFRTIGGFPFFMGAATIIFFDPRWPQDLLDRLSAFLVPAKGKGKQTQKPKPQPAMPVLTAARKVFLAFALLYASWQLLYPFRHFLYPGDPSLTGEGQTFAWRMMLTARDYGAKFKVVVNGETFYITGDSFWHYINYRQFSRLCRMPKSFHRFALFIQEEMRKTDPNLQPEIYGYLMVRYNGRPYRHLIDTTVNLAALPYQEFGHIDWVYDEYMTEPPGEKYAEQRAREQGQD